MADTAFCHSKTKYSCPRSAAVIRILGGSLVGWMLCDNVDAVRNSTCHWSQILVTRESVQRYALKDTTRLSELRIERYSSLRELVVSYFTLCGLWEFGGVASSPFDEASNFLGLRRQHRLEFTFLRNASSRDCCALSYTDGFVAVRSSCHVKAAGHSWSDSEREEWSIRNYRGTENEYGV